MTNGTSRTCPFCSMPVPAGATTCPNCGGAVQASAGGGVRPLGGFGAPPGAPYGPPPGAPFGQPPGGPPGFAPPAYTPPPSFGPPMGAAYPSTSGGGKVVIIVIAVIAVLLIGAVGAGVAVSLALRRDSSGFGSSGSPIPISMGIPVEGDIYDSSGGQFYELYVAEPTLATISVDGDFDNYLELYEGSSSSPFMQDDDSGNGLNAQITTMLSPGSYRILVRPFSSGTGHYTLTVTGGPTGGGLTGSGGYGRAVIVPQTLGAVVVSSNGVAPVPAGTACSVEIGPAGADSLFNCRVRVVCGGSYLYGAGSAGYNSCTVSEPGGPQVVEAHDNGISSRDGDPMMDIQTASRQLTVSDGEGPSSWTVTLQLGAPGGVGPASSI